jgi:putative drug exporter of the RND superfamily
VRRGLAETGGVITSAALIMVCVFASFVLVDNPTVKIFGLGLATAIVVDATIVRCLLVPATMVLLGRWNWWLPRRLDRLLPHLLDHRAPAPEPGTGDGGRAAPGERAAAAVPAAVRGDVHDATPPRPPGAAATASRPGERGSPEPVGQPPSDAGDQVGVDRLT